MALSIGKKNEAATVPSVQTSYAAPGANEDLSLFHCGPLVENLQSLLNQAGATPALDVNGLFDKLTEQVLVLLGGSASFNQAARTAIDQLIAFRSNQVDGYQSADPASVAPPAAALDDAAPEGTVKPNQLATLQPAASTDDLGENVALPDLPGFQALSVPQQQMITQIFEAANADTQQNLLKLLQRSTVGAPPRPQSALLDVDSTGHTLLDNLYQMASQPIAPALEQAGVTKESLISSVALEAASPGEINQSVARGTCGVTAMQIKLSRENPAEYVRLMAGLASPEGQVTLKNGAPLVRVADSLAPDSAVERSSSERLFQAAMMDYCDGTKNYSNVSDANVAADGSATVGEDERELARGAEGVFGETYAPFSIGPGYADPDDVVKQLALHNGKPTLVSFKIGVDANGGTLGHVVLVNRVENGRVYFDNPLGVSGYPTGSEIGPPVRRIENEATNEQSMSVDDFKGALLSAVMTSSDVDAAGGFVRRS